MPHINNKKKSSFKSKCFVCGKRCNDELKLKPQIVEMGRVVETTKKEDYVVCGDRCAITISKQKNQEQLSIIFSNTQQFQRKYKEGFTAYLRSENPQRETTMLWKDANNFWGLVMELLALAYQFQYENFIKSYVIVKHKLQEQTESIKDIAIVEMDYISSINLIEILNEIEVAIYQQNIILEQQALS